MKTHQTVDEYIKSEEQWQEALSKLRRILLSAGLKEEVKWGGPVYTLDGKNVVGLGAFKSYAGLWFFQGALLKDEKGLLVNAQEGKTKAQRQMRFHSIGDIDEKTVRIYVEEAIRNQQQGKVIKAAKNKPLIMPEELKTAFVQNPSLKTQFDKMALTKQREYAEYIAEAKREETRLNRLEKIKPMILRGIGLNDKYRST